MKIILAIISLSIIVIRDALVFYLGKKYEMYVDYQWIKFKNDYSKTYDSLGQELYHYDVFQEHLKRIEEHNKKYEAGKVSWMEGINEFSDLNEQELKNKHLFGVIGEVNDTVEARYSRRLKHVMNGNAPDSIDWRDFNVLTKVRQQSQRFTICGSCWAISAVGSIESQYAIKTKELVELSVQELIDCTEKKFARGCEGGMTFAGFQYVMDNGVDTEESYPYEARDGICRKTKSKVKISGYVVIPKTDEYLMDAVGTVGPVSVAMKFDDFTFYGGGIVKCADSKGRPNHAVLLIGYGEEDGVPYWLLRNSWGERWGEKGDFRIQRGIDKHDCGIHDFPFYPIVDVDEA
ncbi:unnamed protein product [Phyllotreta striolata]|uniref:Uncharacterized protein n=1 Tax=Phyllotreta striolata TaxID=444603 RepID=A0A9N9XPQ8_PHYSR|nr:unnamed protein product [Phyllotreta striolata]